MKVSRIVIGIALAFLAAGLAGASPAPLRLALVYSGKGAAEGGPEAVAEMAESAGLEVQYLSDLSTLPKVLPKAALFAIGGTEDDLAPILKAFTAPVVDSLKKYLAAGGRYLGICGGGYLASTGWEDVDGFVDALGLVDAKAAAYVEESDPMIISVKWLGKNRPIYYQYGPNFEPAEKADYKAIALYDDGTIAALVAPFGKGKVALVGPHPEADASWLDDDPPPKDAGKWKPTADLAKGFLAELLSD